MKSHPAHRLLYTGVLLLAMLMPMACNLSEYLPSRAPESIELTVPASTGESEPTVAPIPTNTPLPTATPTPLPAVRIEQADQALEHGDWERAYQEYHAAYMSASELDEQSAALLGMGRANVASGQADQSIQDLEKLTREYPDAPETPEGYFSLAQAYQAAGRYIEAADAYLNYLALRPGVVDAYVLDLRGDALQAAGSYAEAASDYRAALQSPSFLSSLGLKIKIARTHALAGDHATAIALYDEVYANASSDYMRAQMDWYKGQSYTALGDMDNAYAAYLDAVNNYPVANDSYQALIILMDDGVPVNELNRGIVDYYAGQYGVALAAFDRYFQSGPAQPTIARYYNGLTYRALGGHEDAIGQWDKIINNFKEDPYWDDAWDQKAYTQWAFIGDYERAIQTLLGFVAAVPDHLRAGEFLYDAALVQERDGRLEQAAETFERVAREYPAYENAVRALLLSGVSYYRAEKYERAYEAFTSLLANASSFEDRAAAYLWQGKAQQALGNAEAAQAAWGLAANTDPTGYYSERARDILRGVAPFTPPEAYDLSVDLGAERLQAEAWMRTTFTLPEELDLSGPGVLADDARFQRGNELWRLGLYEQARLEFEDLRQSLQANAVDSFRLVNSMHELGLYRSAILAARQVLDLAGMDDASTLNAPIYFNHLRFGAYYADLIVPVAEEYGFHPLLLFSLVRQESAFEGFVRSSAGARGLMQIIPATGLEIVTSLDWPADYTDEDLYRPLVSIRLGADYLAEWYKRLDNDMYAALAAYNGGPGNATEWQKLANGDVDVLLEVVRYAETRNYIRGVYELFCLYRRIYNRTP